MGQNGSVWYDRLVWTFEFPFSFRNVIFGFEMVPSVSVFKDNWTALISASKEGHVHVVEELLKCGADLEHRDMVCARHATSGRGRLPAGGRYVCDRACYVGGDLTMGIETTLKNVLKLRRCRIPLLECS